MAVDWNGNDIADAAAENEETTQPSLVDALLKERADADYRRKLDKDLLSFLRSKDARDEEKCFKTLDEYTKNRWGVVADRGNCWTPDRQPYAAARQYADAMIGVLNRGYSAIATPEYKEWMKARGSGDRAAMIKAAGITADHAAAKPDNATEIDIPGFGASVTRTPKTDAEIDAELKDYGARIEGQNFVDTYRAVGRDFSPAEKEMVNAALKNGDGLPSEYEADFAYLVRTDPEKANRVLFCINRARRNEAAFWRDVRHSFTKTAYDMWRGTVTFAEETAGTLVEKSVFEEMVGQASDSAKYYWNDAEKAEYKRLLESNERGTTGGFNPKDVVDRMCADRLRREAMPKEERIQQRRERVFLEEAMGHQPYTGYNYAQQAVIGAVSTIPYMAYTAVPYVGFCANVASYFEQTRDDILMAGGDMDEAVGTQVLLAAAWAVIEKLEFAGLFGKPMTALRRKAAVCAVWKAAGKDKLAKIGKLAAAGSKELLATTIYESLEEGAQGGIEGAEKAWFGTHDIGKAIEAGGKQAVGDFVDSIGTMGILGIVGTGWKTARANANAANMESLADLAAQRLQVMNTLRDFCIDHETDAAQKTPAVKRIWNEMRDIWNAAPNSVAALDQLRDKYGLDEKTAQSIADVFDLEDNMLDTARRMKSKDQAFLAAYIAGAFRVGDDTTYDPVDLLRLVNPKIKVEAVEVDDRTKNPTQKPVSAETQTLRDQLAEAQKRIDNAAVGSERRAAERDYRRINKKLKVAEAKEEAPTYPKMRVLRAIVPVGTSGETRSFTIVEDREGPDIHSTGFAISVANEMKKVAATGEAADGSKISTEDFKLISPEEKTTYAVTAAQYLAMTDSERDAYCRAWQLQSGGDFRVIDDATGKDVFGTDAVVKIMRAFGNPHARKGGNWTLAHEYGHAISSFAAAVGIIKTDSASVAVMRKLFGDPTNDKEMWNEEAANDAFAEYLRGKYDFKRLTPEERKASRGFFRNMLSTLRGLFSLSGNELPDTPIERSEREKAMDAAFEALRTGDFAGLDVFAGIDFAEDTAKAPAATSTAASTGSAATASSVAESTQKAASTPSAQKTPNHTTKPKEAPVAAPTPVSVAYEPIAPENAPLRAGTKRTIFTPGYEMSIEADVMWVPLASLVESTDDREVQMRDRSRVATDQQVLSKTRKGVFQPLALFPGTKSDDGAPIVGGGLRIISGHGRKRMLDQLVKEGRFGEYLAAINAEARRQGLPTAPEDMENPVLVSRVTGGLDSRENLTRFAELSNRWGGLERSGAEHAESDARKISDALLRLYSPDASGNLLAASNRPFMAAFLKEVGATGLTNADGTPTAEAALRVQRAMMTAIFGNDERTRALVQNLLERNQELSLATLQNALLKAAGKLLSMKRRHGSFDIVSDVREAAYQYIAWRSAQAANPKLTLADHLNQSDFFAESVPPMQQALAKLLEADRFGRVIEKYSELVAQQADDAQGTFAGIAENRTPLQLLGLAERALLTDGDAPVTPDPASSEAAAPVQTPPAAQLEPTPEPTDSAADTKPSAPAVETAQKVLAPPQPETFVPSPIRRGTATLPGPGAAGISGYEVDKYGVPTTKKKDLPPGAYNLLRAPYDVKHPPRLSEQDKAGRGLGISNPPVATDKQGRFWGEIFPKFMGHKTDMANRTSQAIRKVMSPAERAHYDTVVDYFGGGGCWGLYHALTNFPNVKTIVINEFDQDRIEKIRLLQEIDSQVADEAEKILFEPTTYKRIEDLAGNSSSPATVATKVREALLEGKDEAAAANSLFTFEDTLKKVTDPRERAVLRAFVDCASTMLATEKDANNHAVAGSDLGIRKAINVLREDGKRAKEAADAFKNRGGKIFYRQGDASNFQDAPSGDRVVAVCDPPYYLTADYVDGSILPLEKTPYNWSYEATRDLLRGLVDKGDAIVYTDEAWWNKEDYTPDMRELNGVSTFSKEQGVLLDIINTIDNFDVAGRVAGRQELLGVNHGHQSNDTGAESGADYGHADAQGTADAEGKDGARFSVRRMARDAEGESRTLGGARSNRGREGRRAIAREVIVQDIADSISSCCRGLAVGPDAVDRIARYSVRQVREDRMAAYAATVSKNAKRWLAKAQEALDAHMAANGYTEKVWHGTNGPDFNAFKSSSVSHDVPAIYFTYNQGTAQNYAALRAEDDDENRQPNTRQFYVNPGKVLDIDETEKRSSIDEFMSKLSDAYEQGYDSVRVKGALDDQGLRLDENDEGETQFTATEENPELPTDILIVFDRDGNPGANRIKAADPVTFMDDVDGSLPIPLEMRADQSLADVRYSVRLSRDAKKVLPEASLNVLADAGRVQTKRETTEERHSVFIGIKGADKAKISQGRLGKALEILVAYELDREAKDMPFDPTSDDAFRRDVYVKTGWWMGTDGLWRYEIGNVGPKQRFGKTSGDGRMLKNGIMFADKDDHSTGGYCLVDEICRHPALFKAYPELKEISVKICDPDEMGDYAGSYNFARREIEISWDMVQWHDGDMSNVLTGEGVEVMTHELQHAVQEIENFSRGGSYLVNGPENYHRLAGEVEARNAASRMFGVYDELSSKDADETAREMFADSYAPWATEDVPQAEQVLVGSDGQMRDSRGNRVERRSVRRRTSARSPRDLATALVASRRLAGKDMKPEDVDKIVRNLGLSETVNAADLIERANTLADRNREKLRGMVERGDPALVATLARQGYADSLTRQLDNLITGTAATADPSVGAKVQKLIQSKATRNLMNAKGFEAAQMMAELPVDLAKAIFAVAEYEKTPEEMARLEAAKKRREEERAAAEESEEDALEAIDDPVYREPTDEERAKLDALLDRARFMEEARKAEEDRKKADRKRKAEASEEDSADGGSSSGEGEADAPILPLDTVRRIAPVFESADMFAAFLVEWTADHVAEKHPNIPTTAEMWKNPVAIRELKQTATHILRKLAKDVLGSPSLNYSRNLADHVINELESDAECRTYNAVRRKIAYIYDQIHTNALNLSRREMVKKLVKTIRQKAIERGRFSAVKEGLSRKIDAKTEQWCRWLVPALTMSEEKLQDEINRLTALSSVDPSAEDATPEDKMHEAADHLAVLNRYGGLLRKMPGEIADAEAEIMELLDGKLAEFEQRREERKARCEAITAPIIAAMQAGAPSKFRKERAAVMRWLDSMQGNVVLEMQALVRFCPDENLRRDALLAIDELRMLVSEGESQFNTELGAAQRELNDGLKACYGDVAAGIRHLMNDKIPETAAKAIFKNLTNGLPTYGQLLQLYAETIQTDYKENAEKHGRIAAIPLMEATLTDADKRFHAFAVEWYKNNRKRISPSVEAVTGLSVASPDALYCPARMDRVAYDPFAGGLAWNPVPNQLNRRIPHELDFAEDVNFFDVLLQQCKIRAQTIAFAERGIMLRDTIASHDLRRVAAVCVGKKDVQRVVNHVRDILVQGADDTDANHFLGPLNVARRWVARTGIAYNAHSVLMQGASISALADVMVDGEKVGLMRLGGYLTSVATEEGRKAISELVGDMGFKARYEMGWSEDVQNVLRNPSRNKYVRYLENAYDVGFKGAQAADRVCSLWMAQGLYRDLTARYLARGMSEDEAKRRAKALTISAIEETQQSARISNQNALMRKSGVVGSLARLVFQYKSAQLLMNNFVIANINNCIARPKDPKNWTALMRSAFIVGGIIPAYTATVEALWRAIMGEEPPEDEERMPPWFGDFASSLMEGVTAPMFFVGQLAETTIGELTGNRPYRQGSGIPAIDQAQRMLRHALKASLIDPFDADEEMRWEKVKKDLDRLSRQILKPYGHIRKAVENRSKEED